MQPGFEQIFNTLEDDRSGLFKLLETVPEERLNLKPSEDKWSIVQIVFHIVKADRVSVFAIVKELKSGKNVKSGSDAEFRSARLVEAMKSDTKFKAPGLFAKVPDTYDLGELQKKWETSRVQLKEILEELPEEAGDLELYEHPYAGRLSLIQGLEFLHHHYLHHLKQIKKLLDD